MSGERVAIVGAGIGGLTLALCLHRAGIACRVYEQAAEIRPLGVGINLLPHAIARARASSACSTALDAGRGDARARRSSSTASASSIYGEPAGRYAGYDTPQFSIHRGDLQARAARRVTRAARAPTRRHRPRLHRASTQDEHAVRPRISRRPTARRCPQSRRRSSIGCDGIHSAIRKQLYPDEGPPRYSGVNMWRGVTRWQPFLSGASMVRAGWLTVGKMVIYPIRNDIDAQGRQLVNWVAEIETPTPIAARLEPRAASSRTSSPPSPTGTSTGSTCRR